MDSLNGLFVTRRPNQWVQIGEGPTAIRVQLARGEQGGLGLRIDAPRGLLVLRGELLTPEQQSPLARDR